jgi:hypothetical protein
MKGAAIYLRRSASLALAGLQRKKPAGIKPGWFSNFVSSRSLVCDYMQVLSLVFEYPYVSHLELLRLGVY